MTAADDTTDAGRKPPGGDAWRETQKRVSERNEQARKAGREQRAAHEKQLAAIRRAEEARGKIYR
jgi:hypothetical protein